MKKYVLCPGYVQSRMDGQIKFVGAQRLAELYGVPMSECYENDANGRWRVGKTKEQIDSMIWLFPDYSGRYVLK